MSNTYSVQVYINGIADMIIKADNDEDAFDSAQARIANIERHLKEKLLTELDVSYDFSELILIDTDDGKKEK